MDFTNFIPDPYEHRLIHHRIDGAERQGRRLDEELLRLEARIRALETANTALWSLLKTKLDVTDEELTEAIRHQSEPDEEPAERCPACDRLVLVKSNPNCSWCGLPLNRGPFGEPKD
ncbi:hypothetical protein EON81_18875 [bacterium]|nr:MAG: hypothetical protein EON81_18875 [bacterium]